MSLNGRVALVTGGSRGIGRGIAIGLALDGADVAVNFANDEQSALETVERIHELGRRAIPVKASIESPDDDEAMVRTIEAELGPIGILVNNAGVASRGRSVADSKPDEISRIIGIHAIGAHHLSRLVIPTMRTLDRGDIVMISSVTTKFNDANGAPYNMGKAALEALAFTLAKEEAPNGIHVNVVAPGIVDTEMGRRLVKATVGGDDIHVLDASLPFGRVCQPEDVADVVRFMVSDASRYVTGQRVYVDGGRA
jgi:NAD(P)-dependent dehydrogenase (short-subunit alcohol dehydrogenase family)